jgi:hypothetical protein
MLLKRYRSRTPFYDSVTEGYFPYKPSKKGGKQDHVINLVTLNAETGSGRGKGPAANTVLGPSMPEAM